MRAWIVRAGKSGEHESWALESSVVGVRFENVGSLEQSKTREEVRSLVASGFPGAADGRITNFTGQLWAFRARIEKGDLVVLPLKTTSQIAIGEVAGGYEYRESDPDRKRRHVRPVRWLRADIPRTAVHQDLLYSLGAAMTVCEVKRNNAAQRLKALADNGADPGDTTSMAQAEINTDDDSTAETATEIDIGRVARDRVIARIQERFSGHGLARLVAEVLRAEGLVCDVSPPGPDGGVDIIAAGGRFGLERPRLVVQVKSGTSALPPTVVRELEGVITQQDGDQGLLVAWGGLNRNATQEIANRRFKIRFWDADRLIEEVCKVYDRLPQEIRTELPLEPIWTVADETG